MGHLPHGQTARRLFLGERDMDQYMTRSMELEWVQLVETGIKTDGISVKALRIDKEAGRPLTFLIKFEAGASYPKHSHPAGEEVFVLEGDVHFSSRKLNTGDYLYTPPGGVHEVYSEKGCVLLFIVPEEVVIL